MKRAYDHDAAPRVTLGALPPSLVREHVFCFLAAPALLSAEQFVATDFQGQLAPLRAVCRQWKETADRLWQETKHAAREVQLYKAGSQNKVRWLRDAAAVGARTRCLALSLDHGVQCATRVGSDEADSAASREELLDHEFWLAFFSHFQHIERLELAFVPFDALVDIIPAAATSCRRVQAVVLPLHKTFELDDDLTSGGAELHAVTDGLKQWHEWNGGLRLLHVPSWPRHRQRDLLEAVVRFCPKIRYLRGRHFDNLHQQDEPVTSLGLADQTVWTDFCRVCTELREIDWRLASLWGPYVSAFCETPKPQLRKMVVQDQRGRANVDLALKWLQSTIDVTSRLRMLQIDLRDRIFFLITENHTAYADITSTIADAFILHVVERCPQLECFHYRMQSSDRELSVTTSSLSALIAMPSVRDIELTRVVIDTLSLPELIHSTRVRPRRSCEYCNTLQVKLTAADAAHDSIVALLHDLAENPSNYCDLDFNLHIGREHMVRNTYPRGILVKNLIPDDDLNQLIYLIERNFAGSRVRVSINTYCFGVKAMRHAISELSFDSTNGMSLRPACEIFFKHVVPQYKRKAGRIA